MIIKNISIKELSRNFIGLTVTNGRFLGKQFYSKNSNEINKFKPVVVYSNADTQKELIFKDNKGKSGVYS